MDFAKFRDAKEAEIGDDNFSVFQKDIFRFQVFVDNSACMKVAHALNQVAQCPNK